MTQVHRPGRVGEVGSGYRPNRSVPDSAVITVLFYPDVPAAVAWLTGVLPLTERLRNSDDRRQLIHGNGAIVVTKPGSNMNEPASVTSAPGAQIVTLRVTAVDALCERARQAGARILTEPSDKPFGERQCSLVDPWGHPWTLSETMFDSDPADWGGQLFDVRSAPTLAELLSLEEQGWEALSADARTARTFYSAVLADDAVMVFPGGIEFAGKDAILKSLGAPWSRHTISDARAVPVSSDAGILTYRVRAQRDGQPEYHAHISSTYVRHGASWQLVFHQHTLS